MEQRKKEMFEIIRDMVGWSVIGKLNSEHTRYGFLSKKDAEEYCENKIKEMYQGGGVVV